MRRKRCYAFLLLLLSYLTIASTACSKQSVNQDDLDKQTLGSLKQVDNSPLYIMTYKGKYGFREYLSTGKRINTSSIISKYKKPEHWACTCFAAMSNDGDAIFGRNFDWYNKPALLLFTDPPDGYSSVSIVDIFYLGYTENIPMESWDDRKNLLEAPYYPFDGMNEHGVAIGMMSIPYVKTPYDPEKVTIQELEVIRLVLDYAKNTEEAISLIAKYNVQMEEVPIHYLIADPSGKSAVIEFIDGEMVVIRNNEPFQVSTNFIIHKSGAPEIRPSWRYDTVYRYLLDQAGNISEKNAMDLLERVSQSNTMWSAVYNMITGEIQVSIDKKFNNIKRFNLK